MSRVQESRFKGYGISVLWNIHAVNYKLALAQRAPMLTSLYHGRKS